MNDDLVRRLREALEEVIAEVSWFVARQKNLAEVNDSGQTWAQVLDSDLDIARRALKIAAPMPLPEAANRSTAESATVVVPREPTKEMQIAAGDIGDGFNLTSKQICMIYRAMLAAAQGEKP